MYEAPRRSRFARRWRGGRVLYRPFCGPSGDSLGPGDPGHPRAVQPPLRSESGGGFGLFAAAPAKFRLPFFLGVAIFALFAITVIYLREGHESRRLRLGLAMLAGGAGANLLERLLVGEVVDYLDVYVGTYHWPTFNLADIAINVGVGLLLLETFRDRGASRRAPTGREEGRP